MLVTPNHKMLWFDTKYKEWTTIEAKDLPNRGRLRTVIDRWKGEIPFKTVTLDRRIGKIIKGEETGRFEGHFENFKQDLPLEDYLRFVGYWISEGSWSGVKKPTLNSQTQVVVYQQTTSPCYKEMEEFFDTFQIKFNKYTAVTKTKAGGKVYKRNMTTWSLCDDELAKHLIENYGAHAYDKHLPVWVKNLPREYLKILLDVMVAGDGSEEKDSSYTTKKGEKRIYKRLRRSYYSTSKQLADDIQEIVYKMGYAPKLRGYIPKQDVYYYRPIYTVYWSETTKFGHFPHLQAFQKWGVKKEFVEYDSTIWCVGVPNHFFVTRRNGNPCVSSNSPKEFYFIGSEAEPASQDEINDFRDLLAQQWSQPNQAIVYHHAVRVQWEGAAGRILPLQPEFQYLDKQLAIALLINEGILTAERQPYASTSVALDVMIQRYLTTRMRVENWIENKVFKPICRLHKIYKRTKNEIEHRIKLSHTEESLWIPKVKWDKEELRNDLNKVRLLIELADKNWLPRSMVLPFLNVDPDTARKEVRMEKAKDKKEGFTGEPGMPGMPGMGAPTLPMSPPGEDEVPLSPEEMSLPEAPEGEGGAVPPESHEGTLPGGEGSLPTSV